MGEAPRRASLDELPILNFDSWHAGGDVQPLVEQLHLACVSTGFFYVQSQMPKSVIAALFDVTRRYFELPLEVRLQNRIDERFHRGFMPYGVNQHPGFTPDLKESYTYGLDLPLTDPDVVAGRPLHGPNFWPAVMPELKVAGEAYLAECTRIGRDLLRLFALALEQEEEFFLQWARKPMIQSRLLHYPAQDVDDDMSMGVAPHTDYGMITILYQDPIGGLELCKRDGEWISAPYIEDTLVVNLGDMMKVWSNDVFVSNFHRVVNRSGKNRYSFPTFFNPDYDAPVYCLLNCQSDTNPPRYPPMRAGDYLVQRFSEVQKYNYRQGAAQ